MLDASLLRRYECMRPANERSADLGREAEGRRHAAPSMPSKRRPRTRKPGGKRTTIGHIAIGCALGYLDFRFAAENWRTGRPNLARWYEAFAKRPSMAATVPKDPT